MKIFDEAEGWFHKNYDDDVINIRIECEKLKGESLTGDLAKILKVFGLSERDTFWDVKKHIWKFLKITSNPEQLRKERLKIFQRSIDNAGDVPILRNTEGKLLLSALGLPKNTPKRDFEDELVNKILKRNSIGQ